MKPPRLQCRLACLAAALLPLGSAAQFSAAVENGTSRGGAAMAFTFVRVEWRGERPGYFGRGPLWAHDYPTAEQNLYTAIGALTGLPLTCETKTLVLEDEAIFDYPFLYICEVGYWMPEARELMRLREFLLRGGFLLVDDFRGGYEWNNFAQQLQRLAVAVPRPLPLEHPIFHCFFDFGQLGDHAPYGGMSPLYYGLFDAEDRLMAVINFNNDIGDGWEWPEADEVFSAEAFKLGINYLIYAMTH